MTGSPPASPAVFVLDATVALGWYFVSQKDPYADRVALSFPTVSAVVPRLWHLEVANAVVLGERRSRATLLPAAGFLTVLQALPIAVDAETETRAWTDTLTLARRHGLTGYDAAYLELAVRLAVPLATLDKQLLAAAPAAGVTIFQP